ncbi:MAG: tyrosine-type recombinase/integrase [Acidobacteriota bacterium]
MTTYKPPKSQYWWFRLHWRGDEIRKSTRVTNRREAERIAAAYREALARSDAGIPVKKTAPTFADFSKRFMQAIEVRCASKPATVGFYREKVTRLLEYPPLASARLDDIDEALIEGYVQQRREHWAPATVNRALATLRRALRLAYEWKVINRVPRTHFLPGERCREFVLSHEQEKLYLEATPQPLRDVALLILDTALRPGEALDLEWPDIHLEPATGAKFGYAHVLSGNAKNRKSRNVSLTTRVREMLAARQAQAESLYVFPGYPASGKPGSKPYRGTSLDHQHLETRTLLKLPKDFVVHSLRHTALTRLGEAGADAFTIMRIAGHSSITVSQRYVHPTPEALERAFERLEALNANRAELRGVGIPTGIPAPGQGAALPANRLN